MKPFEQHEHPELAAIGMPLHIYTCVQYHARKPRSKTFELAGIEVDGATDLEKDEILEAVRRKLSSDSATREPKRREQRNEACASSFTADSVGDPLQCCDVSLIAVASCDGAWMFAMHDCA